MSGAWLSGAVAGLALGLGLGAALMRILDAVERRRRARNGLADYIRRHKAATETWR